MSKKREQIEITFETTVLPSEKRKGKKPATFSSSRKGSRKRREELFLEPLTGKIKRARFVVYDIESKNGDTQEKGFTRPFMAGFYDGKTHTTFRNAGCLVSRSWETRSTSIGGCIDRFLRFYLTERFAGSVIYAHNGGNFDHLFLLPWLTSRTDEFGFEIVPVQSSIQKLDVWRKPQPGDDPDLPLQKWVFLDSVKLLPMALDKAAKTFGLPGKEEMDLDLHEDDPKWELYNRVDNEQLYLVLERAHDLIEQRLGGEVGLTAPSTSMKLYRRRFLGKNGTPEKIPRYQHFGYCPAPAECEGCCHLWVRQAYYGGRTEIFKMSGEGLRYYDINSSYVAAMQETMPAGDRIVTDTLEWDMHESHVGFVECTVSIPVDTKVPPLPFRHEDGKLIFPVGVFSGVWDTEELALLKHPAVQGEVLEVKKVVWFKRKILFAGMVTELYRLRDKALPDYDEGLSALAKLMGNSLYGKFGMKEERTQIVFARTSRNPNECFLCGNTTNRQGPGICDECEGSRPASGNEEDAEVWYQKKRVSAPYIIPQIAAHITSLARVRIWRFMVDAVDKGGTLYYTDTDSVITDVELPTSTELGALKDEYPGELLKGEFIQPKVYMLTKDTPFVGEHLPECKDKKCKGCALYKIAMKGFGRDIRTIENLQRLKNGEVLKFKRLTKVRGMARTGFAGTPQMMDVEKGFRTGYTKRLICDDNWSTMPIVLSITQWNALSLTEIGSIGEQQDSYGKILTEVGNEEESSED